MNSKNRPIPSPTLVLSDRERICNNDPVFCVDLDKYELTLGESNCLRGTYTFTLHGGYEITRFDSAKRFLESKGFVVENSGYESDLTGHFEIGIPNFFLILTRHDRLPGCSEIKSPTESNQKTAVNKGADRVSTNRKQS